MEERDVMEVDVLFVGGGIANLSGALPLPNLVKKHNQSGGDKSRCCLRVKGEKFGVLHSHETKGFFPYERGIIP